MSACSSTEAIATLQEPVWPEQPRALHDTRFVVKNTFIDMGTKRDTSLERFVRERREHSCPARSGTRHTVDPHGISDVAVVYVARRSQFHALPTNSALPASANLGIKAQNSQAEACVKPIPAKNSSSIPVTSEMPQLQVIRLADALRLEDAAADTGPISGMQELPSVGSLGHFRGQCKPCAFVHTKGCTNGKRCQFCHLCDPRYAGVFQTGPQCGERGSCACSCAG